MHQFSQNMSFSLTHQDSASGARAGMLTTAHGKVPTPIFMPVGTQGTVKGITQRELKKELRTPIILANTYHLYLRPGIGVLERAGGLHRFMNWDGPILTDSGGYQVHSLASRRSISEAGVTFRSHIDGSCHLFTPERAIDIQRSIGADIIMAFDECTPSGCSYGYARASMERTHRWLERCKVKMQETGPRYGHEQLLFPIVQGAIYKDLRAISSETIAAADLPGCAIGGVCHPTGQLYEVTGWVCEALPKEKPRYLMGVGTPEDLLHCIGLGVDMFDCVMPARNGRNGMLFTNEGRINIKNSCWREDFSPIDKHVGSEVSSFYSKAYLHHLIRTRERLGMQIATLHNLHFYLWLVREAREQIIAGTFAGWKEGILRRVGIRLGH
jgi:queuine tRNA-ribosyltransferase